MTRNHSVPLDVEAVELPEEVVAAASAPALLVSGPSMTAKFELMLALLVESGDHVMVVTTKHPADRVVARSRSLGDWDEGRRLGVVDALGTSEGPGTEWENASIRTVGSPGNLTRIGIEFSGMMDELAATGGTVSVGLHSLSPLLMSAGLQPVYRFLGTMTGRVRRDGHRAVVVTDTPSGDHDVESLHHHFDAVLETRLDDGRRQLRVSSGRETPSGWIDF